MLDPAAAARPVVQPRDLRIMPEGMHAAPQRVFGRDGAPSPARAPAPPRLVHSEDLGAFANPQDCTFRDGAFAFRLHGRTGIVFCDSLLDAPADDTGLKIRSSTAGYVPEGASGRNALALLNVVDAQGVPKEWIDFTAAQAAANQQLKQNPFDATNKRWAHWTTGIVVPPGDDRGVLYYNLLQTMGATMLTEGMQSFTVTVDANAESTNADHQPLFAAGQRLYYPVRVYDPRTRYHYLVSPKAGPMMSFSYTVARAPVDQLRDASAYEYWAGGNSWVRGDQSVAQTPKGAVMAGDCASISYNRHLKKFVMLTSSGGSLPSANKLQVRVADSIVGEWSDPVNITEGVLAPYPKSQFGVYGGQEQPFLEAADGKLLVASYIRPVDDWHGEARVVAVELSY
jgi:hypothetical protein